MQYNPWPHRIAVLLACVTFPLIWVGGLVTTYDAGMAVPDWPTTYGYNLLLYPWQTWVFGPRDLFIEHGHRLLGALIGMLTIALALVVCTLDDRRWLRYVACGALGLVILQGVLGGMRVLLDDRQLARLHGCVGPAFFALTVAICVFTSRLWRDASLTGRATGTLTVHHIAVLTVLFSYIQLVLGAHVRHVSVNTLPGSFRILVLLHLLMAVVVTVHIVLLTMQLLIASATVALLRPAFVLSLLVVLQLVLGAATWIVKYSWPDFVSQATIPAGFTIESKGWLQSMIVTLHVAVGSLIVATSVQLALRTLRLMRPTRSRHEAKMAMKGALA